MTEQSTISEHAAVPQVHPVPAEQWGEWSAFLTAVQFLTRVPLPFSEPVSAAVLSRCPVYFPLVGGLIGVATSVVVGVAGLFWPVWLAVIVALAIEARLTGAFHEDAVADFCDAFGGGWTRDDVLRILKDSRIGSYGALGLGIAVALRAGAMLEIIQQVGRHNWLVWGSAIVASCAIGRFVIVLVMVRVPPVSSRESLSRDIGRQLKLRDLLTASVWMLPLVLPFIIQLPLQAAICVVALVAIVMWFMALVRRRLGGITGDCLGCIGYGSMVVVLLATAARWNP
ncbi:MAG: cobalamin-5-phosphate synthase CobS [Planctomycetaceae bacterium]|nr:cobalamin-5-phosphate synthase CobS [Planctomycetaceae bacterium]